MSRAYSEDEARKRAAQETERMNKSREWLKEYYAQPAAAAKEAAE